MKRSTFLANPWLLAVFALSAAHQADGQASNWTYTGTGSTGLLWDTASSWSNGVPNAIDASAIFNANRTGTSPPWITLTGNRTVGTLAIDDPIGTVSQPFSKYDFVGGSFTFDVTSGSANLNSLTPENTATSSISGGVTLNDPISINWDKNNPAAIVLYGSITDGASSYSISKSGMGIATFKVANRYDGGTTISAGRIGAENVDSLGTGSVAVTSGGQAYLSIGGTFANAFSLAGDGYIMAADAGALVGALRYSHNTTTSNTITLTGDARVGASGATTVGTMAGPLIGNFNLQINSTASSHNGTIVLNGDASAMTGRITVEKGGLVLGSTSNPGGSVLVDDFAKLAGETNISGNLELGSTNGATLNFDPSTSAKLAVGGNLALYGTTTVVLDAKRFVGGVLPILSYTGTLTGDLNNLVLSFGNYRPGTGFVLDPVLKLISLEVVSKALVWTGASDSTWNFDDENWAVGANPSTFFDFDGVTFNNAGSVTIPSGFAVRPASATFDIPAGSGFQLAGPGTLNNAPIIKRGIGTLTLGNPSNYTATTSLLTGSSTILVEKGNLAFSSLTAVPVDTPITLGSVNSGSDATVLEIPRASADFQTVLEPAITLGALGSGDSSEAILRYTGISAGSNITGGAPLILGPINLNGRNLYLENSSHLGGGTPRLVNLNSVISGTGDVHVRTGANPNGSYNVDARFRFKPGVIYDGSSTVAPPTNTWVGNLFLDTGYLQLLGSTVLQDANNTIPDNALVTMAAGTGIGLANEGETIRGLVGGAATASIPVPAVFEGNVPNASRVRTLTLSDDSGASTHVFDGNVNGGNLILALAKNGAATQVLNGTNNYTGPTTVNGGTLEIGGAGTLGPSRSPGSFTYEGNINIAAGATFKYNSTGNQILGYMSNGAIGGAGTLIKDSTGLLTLIQANSFTGVMTLTGGSLSVATIGNGGVSSNLGAASSAPGNIVFNGGTLLFTGVTAISNRGFTINDGKTAVIDTPTTVNNISLAGATGAATTGSLNKTGVGRLTLTGASNFTGQTLVSVGQLTVAGAGTLSGTSDLSVSDAAAFSYQPTTIGTLLTLGAASALNLADGSTLRLAWNDTIANRIKAQGTASVGSSAGVLIDMGTGTFTSGTSYTILTADSGLLAGSYRFANLTDYTVAVVKTPTSVSITPTTAIALTGAYWRGTATPGLTKSWAATNGSSDSNWASSNGGAIQSLVPGAAADVFIANSPLVAATSTVLGANMTIKSLTIADTTNGLSLNADTNTLTLTPGVATNGIVMNASVPASSIGANMALGANQTWTNNSADALTVSGNISGAFGLTKDGSGPVILTGTNTYGGATNVTAGTLQIAGSGSLNSGTYAGAISLGSGASLRYSSSLSQTLSGAITGQGAIVKDTNSSSLTLSNATNSFSGGITISAGKVSVATPAMLSTGPVTCVGSSSEGGQLHFTSTVASSIPNNFSISGVGFPDAGANPGRAGAIRAANNQTYSGTITLTDDSRFGVIAGVVTNTISGRITGNFAIDFYGGLTADGTHTFILANPGAANDYSGNTSITSVDSGTARTGGAVLQLAASEQIPHGVGKGILVFNGADNTNQTILDLNGFNEILNGISSLTDSGTIRNNAVPPLGGPSSLLTIGAADTSSNFAGSLADASSTTKLELIKIGTGTLTLTGTNTIRGNITVSGGKLSAVRLGASSNSSRAITVASGAVLEFGTGNVFGTGSLATIHRTTAVPPITVNGGTITNAELLVPEQPLLIKVNNAMNNVTLNAATLTATVGNGNSTDIRPGEGYGAWGLNGTVTSTGNSLIDTSAVPGKAGHVLLSSSTVDTTFNVVDGTLTVASILQRGDSATGNRGLIKNGAGVLALTAANIYTGNTLVNAGTLALADNAQLKFVLGATSGSNNALSGAGTVTLDGDFVIDTAAAAALPSGTWTLENVSTLSGAYGPTFRVVDFVDAGGNKWTKANGATTYTFDETTGVLNLSSGDAFATWTAAKGLTGGPGFENGKADDPDKDGLDNLQEFAFDGYPLSGANDGKVAGKVATLLSLDRVLTLTLPVRTGASFPVAPGDAVSGLIDGIYYRIEGGVDLNTFTDNITEVTGTDAANIQSGLPTPLSSGWTYRTFRVSGTLLTQPKAFLRAKISETP